MSGVGHDTAIRAHRSTINNRQTFEFDEFQQNLATCEMNFHRIGLRRERHYYRLLRFNPHRFSYRVAYRYDPGNATTDLIVEMLKAGTLKLDMRQRLAARKPTVGDLELQSLIDRANH